MTKGKAGEQLAASKRQKLGGVEHSPGIDPEFVRQAKHRATIRKEAEHQRRRERQEIKDFAVEQRRAMEDRHRRELAEIYSETEARRCRE